MAEPASAFLRPLHDPGEDTAGQPHMQIMSEDDAEILAAEGSMVPLDELSRALDEIYELRRILAYVAIVTETYTDYKTFPKNRCPVADLQIEACRAAARGDYPSVIAAIDSGSRRYAMTKAGAEETMTRHQWQEQRHIAVPANTPGASDV